MKRNNWGVLALILTTSLTALPPESFGQSSAGSTTSAERLRRDLGEKGQIIIDSLDLYDQDIESVVRLLARVAGINIITGNISGAISVYLENVTVEDALEAILASQGYGFIYDGNIVRVVPAERLGEDRVETVTETFMLNYLDAEAVATTLRAVLQGGGIGSSYSQIEANSEANAIVVIDIPRRMEDIRRMINALDRRFEQVEIEGRFVEISYDQDQDWGVDWRYFQDPANALDVNLAPQPLDAQNVAGQFKFAIIRGSNNLSGFLQMLETTNDIKILASPKTLTVENEEASIELTDEIPFIETNVSQGVITESVQFQETGIRLIVTPTVAQEPEGTYVTMRLELEQRIPGPRVVLGNSIAFPVDSRRAQTVLVAPDESTVVIGGLKSNDQTYTYNKIPFLGSVPVIGAPFRRRTKSEEQTELLLFVTPRVIYETPPLDFREMERHEMIDPVMDELDTQYHWRKRAELPIDVIDKGILYSNVEVNEEVYDHFQATQDCIENVRPYKIAKPKGERPRIHITGRNGELKEEYEYVDEAQFPEEVPPPPVEPVEGGEVRDFSVVEEQALPGNDAPSPAIKAEEQPEVVPVQPLVPIAPPYAPPVPIPPPPDPNDGDVDRSKESDRPNWLRRGNQRGAAEPVEDKVQEAAARLEETLQGPDALTAREISSWTEADPTSAQPLDSEVSVLEDEYYADLAPSQEAIPEGIPFTPETNTSALAEEDPWGALETPSLEPVEAPAALVEAPPEPPSISSPSVEPLTATSTPVGKQTVDEGARQEELGAGIEPATEQPGAIAVVEIPAAETDSPWDVLSAEATVPVVNLAPAQAPPVPDRHESLAQALQAAQPAPTIHRIDLTASANSSQSAPSPPVEEVPATSDPTPARIDLRASVPSSPAARPNLRKYLDPSLVAAMEELDSLHPGAPSGEAPKELSQGPATVAPSPWDAVDGQVGNLWESSPSPGYTVPREPDLMGGTKIVAHNDLAVPPSAQSATAPSPQVEGKDQSWWNRIFSSH